MNNIKKIVLTGGPCAGKTTALVRIIEHFSGLGYKVFTIPEVPTMFTQAGMNYLTDNAKFFYEGEKATLQIQLALEDSMMRMAISLTSTFVPVISFSLSLLGVSPLSFGEYSSDLMAAGFGVSDASGRTKSLFPTL